MPDLNIPRLTNSVARFEGLELRGERVVVRAPLRSDGSTAVICTFESAETAKRFLELCSALPDLIEAASATPAKLEGGPA